MATAFDTIWTKPNAPQVMAAFLDGKVRFLVDPTGVSLVTDPPDDAGSAPRTGDVPVALTLHLRSVGAEIASRR